MDKDTAKNIREIINNVEKYNKILEDLNTTNCVFSIQCRSDFCGLSFDIAEIDKGLIEIIKNYYEQKYDEIYKKLKEC